MTFSDIPRLRDYGQRNESTCTGREMNPQDNLHSVRRSIVAYVTERSSKGNRRQRDHEEGLDIEVKKNLTGKSQEKRLGREAQASTIPVLCPDSAPFCFL